MKRSECVKFHTLRFRIMKLVAPPCWRVRIFAVQASELIHEHFVAEASGDVARMDQVAKALSDMGIYSRDASADE